MLALPSHNSENPRYVFLKMIRSEIGKHVVGGVKGLFKLQIIGSFSVDANREFVDDRSQLKFFNPPNNRETRVRLDLNRGLNEVVRKDEDKCKEERLSM